MTEVAAAQQPLFIALGGDLSYDNGIPACYRRWDDWFDMLALRFAVGGKITPYLVSPGNHEAGSFYQTDPATFSFYKHYFVQENLNGRLPAEMPSFSAHNIGNLLLLSLDSEVYISAAQQVSWLQTVLSTSSQRWLTALYHHPIWPSRIRTSAPIADGMKKAWAVEFERYGLDIAFENHDHAYKRTKPMRADGVATNSTGILYVGDGNWGTGDVLITPAMRDFMDFTSASPYILKVDVTDQALTCTALNDRSETIDRFQVTGFDP